MTDSKSLPYELINQSAQLETIVGSLDATAAIALDTESNSRHHYPEQLCLIQIADGQKVYLIDTLSLKDLSPFQSVLQNSSIQKIIHGSDYDIRCLDRHFGFRVANLYDTSVAARLAGISEFGLAALIKNLLGLTIPKSERLQQSDWGRRPLSAEALDYAAGDVHHLLALRDSLVQKLTTLGRTAWAAEEFARLEEVRFRVPDMQTAYLSIKGGQNLDGKGLAVLRSISIFREDESRRQGRPPFFVIPDQTLVTLAADPAANLAQVPGLGPVGLQRFGPGLRQALRQGQLATPIQRPPQVVERPTPEQATRLNRLKAWRTALGVSLSLDPPLLWPTASLERLARLPETWETEHLSPTVRNWQREQFASLLKTCLQNGH